MKLFFISILLIQFSQSLHSYSFKQNPIANDDYEILNFTAKIDNFDNTLESQNQTFNMKYIISKKYINESSPQKCILFWAGSEGPITIQYLNSGFVTKNLAE